MRGFTLLELMTTLAIFGLVATLSIASLGPLRDRYNHQHAVQMVSGAIVRAQLLARESGRCHSVEVVDDDGVTNTTAFKQRLRIQRRSTANCDGATASTFVEVESLRLPHGTAFKIDTANGVMELRPNGRQKSGTSVLVVVRGRATPSELNIVAAKQGRVCVDVANLGACP